MVVYRFYHSKMEEVVTAYSREFELCRKLVRLLRRNGALKREGLARNRQQLQRFDFAAIPIYGHGRSQSSNGPIKSEPHPLTLWSTDYHE